MSHYAKAVAEAMSGTADVTLIDGAQTGWLRTRALLRKALREGAVLLVTSPHWILPLLLPGLHARGAFVFHDPILDAATRVTRPLHILYYRMLARRLGGIVLHSDVFRRNILELRLRPRRIVVVPHGFVPLGLEVGRPYDPAGPLAFLGRFHPYKGLDVFARTLRLLNGNGLHVRAVVAGRGIPRGAMPDLPGVEVHPQDLTDAKFRDAVAACAAVVLPYERANQSGVLATAFRAGRPVIASAVGSFPEYVRDGYNGLLVPPGDPAALAAAIVRLTTDPALAASLADGARQTWETHLAPKRAAERIVRSLIGLRDDPRPGAD
jgi:glycosyltransferase involved in cell wall biosynthesis